MKSKILLILFVSIFAFIELIEAQNKEFKICLEGTHYDSLFLYNFRNKAHPVQVSGVEDGKSCWRFIITDSLYENLDDFQLTPKIPSNDELNFIMFYALVENDTITNNRLNFDEYYPTIHAKLFKRIKETDVELNPIQRGNIQTDYFELMADKVSDIYIRTREPFYSTFLDPLSRQTTYPEFLNNYIDIAKKYPDSRYLITSLKKTISSYKSKRDILSVFNQFSENNKSSVWGMEIQRYIYSKFSNDSLLSVSTSTLEPIIVDSTKFNLIVIGASWCKPCIEEIPILKELYSSINQQVDFTYITIDDADELTNWESLLIKYGIPWRSLATVNYTDKFRTKYFISGIPKIIIVHPDANWEFVDIRNSDEIMYLKQLLDVD